MTTTTPTKAQHLCTLIEQRNPGSATPEFTAWAETLDDTQIDNLITSLETGTPTPAPKRDLPVEGDRVTGKYCDTPFTGVVTGLRFHTANHNAYIITIKRAEAVTLFADDPRSHRPAGSEFQMMVYADGRTVDDVHSGHADPDHVRHA